MPTIVSQARFRAPANLDLTGIKGLGDAIGGIGKGLRKRQAEENRRNKLADFAQQVRDGVPVGEAADTLLRSGNSELAQLGVKFVVRDSQLRAVRRAQRDALAARDVTRPNSAGGRASLQPRRQNNTQIIGLPGDGSEQFSVSPNVRATPPPIDPAIPDADGLIGFTGGLQDARGAQPSDMERISEARQAILAGADPQAVVQRLRDMGVNLTGVV